MDYTAMVEGIFLKWQTKDGLLDLTCELVSYKSVTGSIQEKEIVEFIEHKLGELPYFQHNKHYLQTHQLKDGRKFITALVKSKEKTNKTIILTGHIDVVDIEDYGQWKHLAFDPKELTKQFINEAHLFHDDVKRDIQSGEWIFGRGVMDMKAGIALCMSMIELACEGEFTGNILFLAVPDEEVNSAGMRAATPALLELSKLHDLDYELVWSTEPTFAQHPGDDQLYLYKGSIGKTLPGFYCYGEETHVGEPFSGLNGNFMVSLLTEALELNPLFSETVGGERTPPPTNLMQHDLKKEYSVQIPHAAVGLFNLMTMGRSVAEITEHLLQVAEAVGEKIVAECEKRERLFYQQENYEPKQRKITVLSFQELLELAIKKEGKDTIEEKINQILIAEADEDDRNRSIQIVHELASLCKEVAPMIVLFYAPPFYPAIASTGDEATERLAQFLIDEAREKEGLELNELIYFPGLSDLSYVSMKGELKGWSSLLNNMPLWEQTYDLPLEAMEKLAVPVISFGPFGKDAHRFTERLHVTYSFEQLPRLLKDGIDFVFAKNN